MRASSGSDHRGVVLVLALSLALCGLACGPDGEPPTPDQEDDSSGPLTELAEVTPCSWSRTLGVSGGVFSGCGARVDVPAGALFGPTVLTVERSAVSGRPPWEFSFASAAYTFTASRALKGRVAITLPYRGTSPRTYPATRSSTTGTWSVGLLCRAENNRLGFVVQRLGTFASVADAMGFGGSPEGLGSGALSSRLGTTAYSFDLDAPQGHGFFSLEADGARTLELWARNPVRYHTFHTKLALKAGSTQPVLMEVWLSLLSNGVIRSWSYVRPRDGAGGTFTPTEPVGDTLRGTLNVTVRTGTDLSVTRPLEVKLDTSLDRWRWPQEEPVCL